MRAQEFIIESITFGPAIEDEYTDNNGQKRKTLSGSKWWRKENQPCDFCDGSGKNDYAGSDCQWCKGTGQQDVTVSDAPELNVSNSNGYAIQQMLGLDPDSSGVIDNRDIPQFIRRLMLLKNKGSDQYTQEPSISKGAMGKSSSHGNVTTIGNQGPTIYDAGRRSSQVEHYIDSLLDMMKFAQQHNASITWG